MRFVLLRQETRDRARENVHVLGVGVWTNEYSRKRFVLIPLSDAPT